MGRRSDRTGADVDGERAGDAHFHVTDPEMPGCRRLLRFGHEFEQVRRLALEGGETVTKTDMLVTVKQQVFY